MIYCSSIWKSTVNIMTPFTDRPSPRVSHTLRQRSEALVHQELSTKGCNCWNVLVHHNSEAKVSVKLYNLGGEQFIHITYN